MLERPRDLRKASCGLPAAHWSFVYLKAKSVSLRWKTSWSRWEKVAWGWGGSWWKVYDPEDSVKQSFTENALTVHSCGLSLISKLGWILSFTSVNPAMYHEHVIIMVSMGVAKAFTAGVVTLAALRLLILLPSCMDVTALSSSLLPWVHWRRVFGQDSTAP